MIRKYLLGAACLIYVGCLAQPQHPLEQGPWRAWLEREDGPHIMFNFEVTQRAGKAVLFIRNAAERLLVDSIRVAGDSIWIRLPFFDSEIKASFGSQDKLHGVWIKRLSDSYQVMAFGAQRGQSFRFTPILGPARASVSGRWAASFRSAGQQDSTFCVGEFVQTGNEVTGTFLNAAGDYRYLQGIVTGDSLLLSCFDGGHAYLFTASVRNNKQLVGGRYYSGPTHWETWTGLKDPDAHLPDEFSLTRLKPGASKLDFSFRDIEGRIISLGDERFRNKVVIVQIMGSWCPNCMDETRFLSQLYDLNRSKGLEIIGLAYERSTDFARSQSTLRSFQLRFNVHYPLLITGVTNTDPEMTQKTLPQLEAIAGFPTMIFIDRSGRVQKILTGFNGPATGIHYAEEKKTISTIVEGLLLE
jgi:thiol-disulfide isomerase/thioredoxin